MRRLIAALACAMMVLGGCTLMPDAPDYSRYQLSGTKDVLTDLGELAARIEARDTWDRRGQVIWWDHFQGGLGPWIVSTSGTGSQIVLASYRTYLGGYAADMIAGSDAGLAAQMFHAFAPAELNLWGGEAAVAFTTEFDSFTLSMSRYDGVHRHQARLKLSRTDNAIYVRDDTGVDRKVGTLLNPVNVYAAYHMLKVVADLCQRRRLGGPADSVSFAVGPFGAQRRGADRQRGAHRR
jgi:hypothetical protein